MGVLLVSLVVLILVIVAAFAMPARTAPITDANRMPVPGSVAILEEVTIGGVKQSVLVRSRSARNPVLLFLHGGPGTSELGMLRAFNIPALEHHFTVVVWDQRGAGKSFAALEPVSGMTVEQLISDAHELTVWLCQRFAQEKIYLVGHSWGSALGVLAVGQRPELYHAYVGFGQVVNILEGERISYEWALARAQEARDSRSVAKLKAIGPPLEHSAHFVNTEEPDAFNRSFVDRLRVETHRPASTQ